MAINEKLLSVLKKELVVTTGCTDPAAIALAAAVARKYLAGEVKFVDVLLSMNVYKNAVNVGIYGTHKRGVYYAAALGFVCGDFTKGLEVLSDVSSEHVQKVEDLLKKVAFNVSYSENVSPLYIEVSLKAENSQVSVVIEEDYNNIAKIVKDNEIIYQKNSSKIEELDIMKDVTIEEIIDFAETVNIDDIMFLKEGIKLNKFAAREGLKNKAGFKLGSTLYDSSKEQGCGGKMWKAYQKARAYTAAAVEARMTGMKIPIMALAGSGNHGVTGILTVLAVAEVENCSEEKLMRSLAISALITSYIKNSMSRVTALCGCGVGAATGATAAISWMLGGSLEYISNSMQSMVGNLTGMICDGAKESCAFKVSVSAGEAVLSAYLASKQSYVKKSTGIVATDIEESLANLGKLNNSGMKEADRIILDMVRSIHNNSDTSTCL